MILDYVVQGDGVDNLYTLSKFKLLSQQALVLVDGVKKDNTINDVNGRVPIRIAGGYTPSAPYISLYPTWTQV